MSHTPLRLLIGEDDADLRVLLVTLFRKNGWDVIAAGDGRELLHIYHQQIYQERYFDALLLDVEMPRLGGFAVGVNVRNLETFGDVPRAVHVYLTGHADAVPPQQLLDSLFADDYIHKPFDPERLLTRMYELVQTPLQARIASTRVG